MKLSRADVLFYVVTYTFLSLCLFAVLYPLVYVVSASFSHPHAVLEGRVWLWPVQPSLIGYTTVFKSVGIMMGYKNSLIYTLFGTIVNVVMTILAAYPLSRKDFVGRNLLMGVFAFTMIFQGGLIPTYLVVKSVRLLDTRLAMIIPSALSVWNLIITRTYFQSTIPDDLLEAATLDGCSDFKFMIHVVLPLSGAIVAVMTLYYGVSNWNSYFEALIFLKSQALYPLQIVLRNILILSQMDQDITANAEFAALRQGMIEILRYSIIVVASVPLLILYPFVQKYFVKGVMIGAIKG